MESKNLGGLWLLAGNDNSGIVVLSYNLGKYVFALLTLCTSISV